MTNISRSSLYTHSLTAIAIQVIIISALFTVYDVEIPIGSSIKWVTQRLYKIGFVKNLSNRFNSLFGFYNTRRKAHAKQVPSKPVDSQNGYAILTSDQLTLFDGSRTSKPVYLALLGKIYNVEKGRKHYAPGGGYSFFAGKDATRAFVTGDFSHEGLIDSVDGLSESEMLSIADWMSFYERDYELVGYLEGTYYDNRGTPTKKLLEVQEQLSRAKAWKEKQLSESEVFPPCNSEWQKEIGGRVWCTSKSGGVKRDWVGVPRRFYSSGDKNFRCACVKNFGNPLATPELTSNRGDLDNPNLREYPDCPSTSISCKLVN